MRSITLCLLFLLCVLSVLSAGCGRPQVGSENQRIVASLRTALSTQKNDWLEQNEKLIEQQHDEGLMSEEAFDAFQAIIEKAKAGQWKEAEKDVVALQRAQRP